MRTPQRSGPDGAPEWAHSRLCGHLGARTHVSTLSHRSSDPSGQRSLVWRLRPGSQALPALRIRRPHTPLGLLEAYLP